MRPMRQLVALLTIGIKSSPDSAQRGTRPHRIELACFLARAADYREPATDRGAPSLGCLVFLDEGETRAAHRGMKRAAAVEPVEPENRIPIWVADAGPLRTEGPREPPKYSAAYHRSPTGSRSFCLLARLFARLPFGSGPSQCGCSRKPPARWRQLFLYLTIERPQRLQTLGFCFLPKI